MTERTLVLIKPDGVQRQLIGRILDRYEERGLKVIGLKLVQVDRPLAERHYDAHREKPFFGGLVDFIVSAPLVALALEGQNAIMVVRAINGATRPHEAAPGTIRGDYALETGSYVATSKDGKHLDHGSFMTFLKKAGGGWKIYRDTWNSSMPKK